MLKCLQTLSKSAIALSKASFSDQQVLTNWIGFEQASEMAVHLVETKLQVELPVEYREFLSITNGFSSANSIEPTFHAIESIDYLQIIDPKLVELWQTSELTEIREALKNSICIAGIGEEQYFLLIPPSNSNHYWRYWKFANWIPGEEEYSSLRSYFETVLEFNQEQLQSVSK